MFGQINYVENELILQNHEWQKFRSLNIAVYSRKQGKKPMELSLKRINTSATHISSREDNSVDFEPRQMKKISQEHQRLMLNMSTKLLSLKNCEFNLQILTLSNKNNQLYYDYYIPSSNLHCKEDQL